MLYPEIFPYAHRTISKVISHNIPFVFITNNGGRIETIKYYDILSKLNLKNNSKINEYQLILSHTPLKYHLKPYKNKLILCCGNKSCHQILQYYGMNYVINTSEIIGANPTINHILNPYQKQYISLDTVI